jgi:ribosomal protein S18 acetylase RimI-like enzyme
VSPFPLAQPLLPQQRREAARLFAEAFFDDPLYVYFFPSAARRLAQLRWLYERIIRMNQPYGACFGYLRPGSSELLAASLWIPPGEEVSLWEMIRVGVWELPLRMGLGSTRRVFEILDYTGSTRHAVMQGRTFWHLQHLAVSPAHQRQGYGRWILGAHLEAASPQAGLPCYLMTSKEQNVAFYRSLGFQVARSDEVGREGPFRFWALVREPS